MYVKSSEILDFQKSNTRKPFWMQSQLFVVLLQYEDLWKKNGANSANFQQEIQTKAAAAHSNLVSIRKTNERIEDAFCFFKGSIEEK